MATALVQRKVPFRFRLTILSQKSVLVSKNGTLPVVPITLNNAFDYTALITIQFDNTKITYQKYVYPNTKSFAQILLSEGLVPNAVMFLWVILLAISMYLRSISLWTWGAWMLAVVQLAMFPNLLVALSSVLIIIINIGVAYEGKKQVDAI